MVPISSRRRRCRSGRDGSRKENINDSINYISINYKTESLEIIHSIRRVSRIVVEEFIVELHIRL